MYLFSIKGFGYRLDQTVIVQTWATLEQTLKGLQPAWPLWFLIQLQVDMNTL